MVPPLSSNRMNSALLSSEIKGHESCFTDIKFAPDLPICIRLDGRSFSRFTYEMEKPYDPRMSSLMIATAKYLVKEYNAIIGYTQSDEISLILSNSSLNPAIFNGKVQKIVSTIASSASTFFSLNFPAYFQTNVLDYSITLPTFDARGFSVPSYEVASNCILWRYLDCQKNAINMAARHYFSHTLLQNKSSEELKKLLLTKDVNFNDYPDFFKYGTLLKRTQYPKVIDNGDFVMRSKIDSISLSRPFYQYTHTERMSIIF